MKKIGIIGAGISGLATAKAFKERGYHITVFEKAGDVGGVWEKSRSYLGVTTQTTKNEYAFSDFPMPADYPEWPTGDNMSAYLRNYATHFDVLKSIQFNTVVLNMEYRDKQWIAEIYDIESQKTNVQAFDFMVVCTGTFHEKYMPAYPGMEDYIAAGGQVRHSSEIKDDSVLKGKKVAVVGFAKSATDIATQAADVSTSTTLLYRKAQWKVPRFFGNKVNLKYLLFSRFSEAFFLPYRKTTFQKFLHSLGKPMVWMQWRGIELLLKKQFKLKECGMIPSHPIENQISCSLGIAPVGFYEKIQSKKITAINTEIDRFTSNEIVLKDGQKIRPDLLVFGTGFRQTLPFLNKKHQQLLRDEQGQFQLYRNILSPKIKRLAFVGFNSSLFSTLTSEVAANWLAEYVNESIVLPSETVIEAELKTIRDWKKNVRPIAAEFSGLCVAPFNFQHLDQLMRDMGLRTCASRNAFYEFFKPINPKDYQKLLGKLNRNKIETRTVRPIASMISRQRTESILSGRRDAGTNTPIV
ncbi:MAG: NAD(P)-binding domain-containing protein [Chitinophagaceae bacterium]|nr:NAD(P)-binding domain-containing protein [Chitinophagaceae bacterium]